MRYPRRPRAHVARRSGNTRRQSQGRARGHPDHLPRTQTPQRRGSRDLRKIGSDQRDRRRSSSEQRRHDRPHPLAKVPLRLRHDIYIADDPPNSSHAVGRRDSHDPPHASRRGAIKRVEEKRAEERRIGRHSERREKARLAARGRRARQDREDRRVRSVHHARNPRSTLNARA